MEKNKKEYQTYSFYEGYTNGKGHNSPEFWLEEHVANKLSNNITIIVDFGCAHGRNFLPFSKEKYKFRDFENDLSAFISLEK